MSASSNNSTNKFSKDKVQDKRAECEALEEKLRHSEERFRIALKNSPITLIELDCDLRFRWVYNPLIDRSIEEIVGKKVGETGATKDIAPLKDFYNEVLKTATAKRAEIKLEHTNREAYYDIYAEPLKDETGKVTGLMSTSTDITERKKTEEALKESEERMRAIAETAIIEISVSRLSDGVILFTNSAYDQTFGFNRGELIGYRAPNLYVNPVDRERIIDTLKKQGFVKNCEVEVKRKDGTPFWVAASIVPIRFGGEHAVLGVSIDISNRKKAEEALRESEQLYRTLFDNTEEGFQLVKPLYNEAGKPNDLLVLKVNKTYESQTGLKESDVVGKTVKEIIPNIAPYWISIFGNVVKTGKSVHIENYNQSTHRWYDVYAFLYRKDQVGALIRDITERKKTQEELSRSNQRMNEILESISDDFMVLDQNWNYVYANSQAAKLVGLEPKDIVGQNFWKLFPQNKGTHIELNLREAMQKREIKRFEILGQYSRRYKLITAYPSIDGIALIAADITERKNLEKQLQEKERMATIGETAGMVGHDLRNPLQTIVSELYLAESELIEMPESKKKANMIETIHSISEQVGYMDKIVSDLQTFVKPVEPHMQIVKLKPLIVALLAQTNIPANIHTSTQIPESLTAEADPQLLKRVLINLVTNAIQAMPHGGELNIKAESNKQGQTQITVEDTGVGIPEEIKPKIFTPLFTTKSKGQGFGLAVCKRVIEAQGGIISFESQESKGSKFSVNLLPKSNAR